MNGVLLADFGAPESWIAHLVPTSPEDAWILAVSAMTNVTCAILGCYLVLRRMSLLGDAISHAVLPGLVLAFLWSESLGIGVMLVGAFAIGLLTTFLTQTLHRQGDIPADSSMGIVFTSLFALGVVLLRRYARGVHLDADCVLQGQLVQVPLNEIAVFGHYVPRAFVTILPVLVLVLLFVTVFWKELKISSFDPELATTMGYRAMLMHYLLMAFVAAATVGSFEAVGSILVVAMLIAPAATAHLLCDRLWTMVLTAVGIALATAYLGNLSATVYNFLEPAGMMAVISGLLFMTAVFFSPRYGLVSALVRQAKISLRIIREDLLAMLFRLDELHVDRRLGAREAVAAIGGGGLAWWGLWRLKHRGFVESAAGGLQLTDAGRSRAVQLVRSHRLWEAYLVEFLGLPLDHVHAPAERMEHFIGEQLQKEISSRLSGATTDPHGRAIPEEPHKV